MAIYFPFCVRFPSLTAKIDNYSHQKRVVTATARSFHVSVAFRKYEAHASYNIPSYFLVGSSGSAIELLISSSEIDLLYPRKH
jgi:hypothetical protein